MYLQHVQNQTLKRTCRLLLLLLLLLQLLPLPLLLLTAKTPCRLRCLLHASTCLLPAAGGRCLPTFPGHKHVKTNANMHNKTDTSEQQQLNF